MVAAYMTDPIPLISVCIANYNGMKLIDDCLRSVLEQEGHTAVEILIHDDASSDGSAAHIHDRYPDARLIVSESNVGFCVANNRMAAKARGKYLVLLNNDAALYPDALQTLLSESNRLNQPAILSLPQYDAASGDIIDRGCLLDPFFNPVPNLDPARQDVAMVIGACLWVPKTLWNELGGFPEWFGSIAEDMYLCCRARLAGHPVRALPVSGYLHWQGKTFGGNRVRDGRLDTTFRRRSLSEQNKTFVMTLTCPMPQLLVILPLHLLLITLEGLLIALLKWDTAVWRAIYAPLVPALWRSRDRLSQLRGEIQHRRQISFIDWLSVFVVLPYKIVMLIKHGLPEIR
jgi:GT2 family glycosyltransferase